MRSSRSLLAILTVAPGPLTLFSSPRPQQPRFRSFGLMIRTRGDSLLTCFFVDYSPRHCEAHHPSHTRSTRFSSGSEEAVKLLGGLKRHCVRRASRTRYWNSCGSTLNPVQRVSCTSRSDQEAIWSTARPSAVSFAVSQSLSEWTPTYFVGAASLRRRVGLGYQRRRIPSLKTLPVRNERGYSIKRT